MASGNRCVLKVCRKGAELDRADKCSLEKKPKKKSDSLVRTRAKPRSKRKGSGGNCGICWPTKEEGARLSRYCGSEFSRRAVRGWCN